MNFNHDISYYEQIALPIADWGFGWGGMNRTYDAIKNAVDVLLDVESPMDRMMAAIHSLHEALYSITGILRFRGDIQEGTDTFLPHGAAISPVQAAECLFDPMRTSRYFQGVYAALSDLKQRFPGQRINILYAGCGPYCLLILLVLTRFQCDDVSITLLDIHQESLDAAKKIVEAFGSDGFIDEYVCADATAYQYPVTRPLHLVITETMKAALVREPQVAICAWLAPQLCEGGVLMPESVTVEAYFQNWQMELDRMQHGGAPRGRVNLGTVFEVNKDTAISLREQFPESSDKGDLTIQCPTIAIPDYEGEYDTFYLYTTIRVFGDIVLTHNQSQLNIPLAMNAKTVLRTGDRIEFAYRMGKNPGFEYRLRSRAAGR